MRFWFPYLTALLHALLSDNIVPPITSCLSDLVTMFLLGVMSTVLTLGIRTAIPYAVIAVVTGCAIASVSVVRRNEHVRPLLSTGWSPLLGAVVVSSASGRVLDAFVSRYEGYAMLAVAFGGVLLRLKAIYRVHIDIPLRSSGRRRLDIRITSIDGVARSWVGHLTPARFRRCS